MMNTTTAQAASVERSAVGLRRPVRLIRFEITLVANSAATKGISLSNFLVPVLFLTGRTEEADRIQGLVTGAVDYIVKPCSLEELSLRIQVHITRYRGVTGQTGILEFPPLRIELLNHRVFCSGEEILLSNKEYELLVCLARNNRKVMTFEEIGKELLGGYIDADRRNIMMNASRLRKKMEGFVGLENMIETVWGKGYCFKG